MLIYYQLLIISINVHLLIPYNGNQNKIPKFYDYYTECDRHGIVVGTTGPDNGSGRRWRLVQLNR